MSGIGTILRESIDQAVGPLLARLDQQEQHITELCMERELRDGTRR